MEYYGELYLEKLPDCFIEKKVVNGIETRCLVIPLSNRKYSTSRYGHLLLQMKIKAVDNMGNNVTHRIYPHFATSEETMLWRSQQAKYEIGTLFRQRTIEENNDRTNHMTEIKCYGSICLDEIPTDAIYVDPRTGKRIIRLVFEKTPTLDGYGNSHEIYVNPKYGAGGGTRQTFADGKTYPKQVIGAFKEYRKDMRITDTTTFGDWQTPQQRQEQQIANNNNSNNNNNKTSFQIDGYDF